MTAIDPMASEEEPVLDEVFLRRVDRAMLLRKQRDPCRLDQVARALDEELRTAHLTTAYDFEPRRGLGRPHEDR